MRFSALSPSIVLFSAACVVGCSSSTSTMNPPGKGSISGNIVTAMVKPQSVREEIVSGQMIVKLRGDLAQMPIGGASLRRVRSLGGWSDVHLYQADAATSDEEATYRALEAVRARPDVVWAEPNYRAHALKVPNDPNYKFQWHYPAFNLPAAWDVTTGNANTVVAIVDTGMLFSAAMPTKSHADLVGKVVGGYDFISDPMMANDGDGRDADSFDVGDKPGKQSSYHGTHVGGTVAAATDNNVGVAGVNWNAKLLDIRVLGVGGGTTADIIDGMVWAAGGAVNGVPMNANPAKVINMSLGGTSPCGQAYQDAIDTVSGMGAIVVVAAGNESADASTSSPANCKNVITVGATGPKGTRAGYSNYGTRVDVMAPGGDTSEQFTVDGQSNLAGVLSTYRDDMSMMNNYDFSQGTSMAAPHIAGLVSLLAGVTPTLTTAQALTVLKMSATKLTADQCGRPSADECGAGIVDAAKALGVPTPPAPVLPAAAAAKTYVIARFDMGGGNFDPARTKSTEIQIQKDANVPYSITALDPGTYVVAVWSDLNGDMQIQPTEPYTAVAMPVMVTADKDTPGIDIEPKRDTP